MWFPVAQNGWLGWLAGCLAGLEGLLDKPDQFSSIQLFTMTTITHLEHSAGWLAGLAGWGYRGRQWSVRLFPHPPAAARGLWVYGASSPRDQVTLSRKRDVRPAD